ncbi:MAG TPA: MoaD/ThiS family protein [Anaerolineales bacterium]|nr:MoaD/ThiS family protein [Anaerolineales bacterium]
MKVCVRLGEPLWREVGERETVVELPESARVADLVGRLVALHPSLAPWLQGDEVPPTIFLNDHVADQDTPLQDGDRPLLAWAMAGG